MRLYLDFDGVLHRHPPTAGFFEHMPLFEAFLRATPTVHVVVSSSWRAQFFLEDLQEFFEADLRERIQGVTPRLPGVRRQAEIEQHLAATAYTGQYLVLDDAASEFDPSWPPLVLCDATQGLSLQTLQFITQKIKTC